MLFVNSAHSAAENALGGGQNPDKPFSTLAYVMTNAASLTPALAAGDVATTTVDACGFSIPVTTYS